MRVTAERDGPDYTGRVIIAIDDLATVVELPGAVAAALFGQLGPVLKEIEANTDPT